VLTVVVFCHGQEVTWCLQRMKCGDKGWRLDEKWPEMVQKQRYAAMVAYHARDAHDRLRTKKVDRLNEQLNNLKRELEDLEVKQRTGPDSEQNLLRFQLDAQQDCIKEVEEALAKTTAGTVDVL